MADQVDALGREIPYLILQKAPQLTLQKLRDKYPDGGEMGWYAFVKEYRNFVYWDVDEGQWKPTGNEEVRHLAEVDRLAAEIIRIQNEEDRVEAEDERIRKESLRISSEEERESAEETRATEHTTAMNEVGEATRDAIDATNDVTIAIRSANLLGTIAHSAAAPTPTSNGFYHFSSGGAVSWLPGAPTVSTGDRVSVSKSGSTYTYTYLPQEDRVLTSPQSLTKAQQAQARENIDVEAVNLWEGSGTPYKYINIIGIEWEDQEPGGMLHVSGETTFESGEVVVITYNGVALETTIYDAYGGNLIEFYFENSDIGVAIENAFPNVTIEPLIPITKYPLEPKNKLSKMPSKYIESLDEDLQEINTNLSKKKDKPTNTLTLNKLDIVWYDGWIKVLVPMLAMKTVLVEKFIAKTGNGLIELNPIVNYPSPETYNGVVFDGVLLKDANNLLSKDGIDFESVTIEYSLSGGIAGKNNTKKFNLGGNVIFEDSGATHSQASVDAFNAVYPEFSGDRVETFKDSLANNGRILSEFVPTYCAVKKADITSYPIEGGASSRKNTTTPNILVVTSHHGNDFERHDLTPSATEFLQNVIAIGAAPATGTPNADWTSYGFGLEFSEEGNNVGLNAAYPDVLFTRDVGSATISADKKVLTITHPSLRFTNIIDLEVGGEIGIGRDNFIILEKRTIASIDSPTQLTVTEPFTVSPTPLTLYIDNAKIGTVWQPNASYQNYYQSPVCAIVMAKFRKIKDLSGANWHICRMAARATASQAGAWDMYRGFGVIDPDAAVQWIEDNYKSDEYQEMLADQLEGLRGISPFISEGKLKKNSPVPKRIVDELLLEKVNIIPGHLLIPVEELAKVQRIDFTVNKSEPLDEDSIGIWDSEEEKFVGTKISDFKEFLTNTFEASVSKSTTLDPESDEDIPTSKAVATYIAGGLFGQIVEFRIENDMHMYYITKAPYANVDLGQVGFVHRGAYDPLYPYRKLDLVTTTDSSYLYIANSVGIGKAVLNTAYWACMADGKPATQAANAANTAATAANQATQDANDAANLANEKAGIANQAAIDANDAVSGMVGEFALKEDKSNKKSIINPLSTDEYPNSKAVADVIIPSEQVTAESLTVLNRRIEALETILANSQYSKIDVLDEFNFFGKTNLILFGVTSPSITPDFIGQFYINTTAGITYQSKGVTNSGDWKQTSN